MSGEVPGDHYFSSSPGSELRPKTIEVVLAGRPVTVTTAGGVFSPDHVDGGTEVLLRTVPDPPPSGDLLDIGCGWGPIALTLALESPDATVYAIDVNERALDLVRTNADQLHIPNIIACRPEDIPEGVEFAAIWSNPPIRVGKSELHAILGAWLPRLEIGADAHLVAAKHLGADSMQRWLEGELGADFHVLRVETGKGFRVVRVRRKG